MSAITIYCIYNGGAVRFSFVFQRQPGNIMPKKVMKWSVCSKKDMGSSRNASPRLDAF